MTTIAVVGPTACGKTARAVAIARAFNGEILSADSRQVYRGMDIGTGKDLNEYGATPVHLIDVADAGEKYNLFRFLQDYDKAEADVNARGKRCILCGGSGLYVESVLKGIHMPPVPRNEILRGELESASDSDLIERLRSLKTLHNITDIDSRQRMLRAIEIEEYYKEHPEISSGTVIGKTKPRKAVVIGLEIPREQRRARITERLQSRLEQGMLDEVSNLLASGVSPDALIYYGLEYKFTTLHLTGILSYQDMVRQLEIAIHQFAKRQMTWWRGMEKRGIHINWIPYDIAQSDMNDFVRHLLDKSESSFS